MYIYFIYTGPAVYLFIKYIYGIFLAGKSAAVRKKTEKRSFGYLRLKVFA